VGYCSIVKTDIRHHCYFLQRPRLHVPGVGVELFAEMMHAPILRRCRPYQTSSLLNPEVREPIAVNVNVDENPAAFESTLNVRVVANGVFGYTYVVGTASEK
jgi:hypothetical protein